MRGTKMAKLAVVVAMVAAACLALFDQGAAGTSHLCPEDDPIDSGYYWTGLDVGRPPVASVCQYRFLWWEHWHTCGLDGCV